MQQVQKVTGVNSKRLSLYLLLFCFSLFLSSASAQDRYDDFQRNFTKNFKYPESLRNACTPTFTNLLVEISEAGKIENILISDSAPKIFKDMFDEIKNKLDLGLLKPIIDNNRLKNCDI